MAEHFGTEHHVVVLRPDAAEWLPRLMWQMDEPIADPAALPTFLLCQYARRSVPVALTGEGSDELLAGYPRYAWFRAATWLQRHLPAALRERVVLPIAERVPLGSRYHKVTRDLLAGGDDVTRHLRWIGNFDDTLKATVLAPDVRAMTSSARSTTATFLDRAGPGSNGNLLQRLLALDMHTWLVDDVLAKVDRMSMAVSVEARVPFLDHRIVEYVAGLPSSLKISGMRGKRLLRRAMRGSLPSTIRARRKRAFTAPVNHWLRGSLRDMLHETVLSTRMRHRGWLNAAGVPAMVDAHAAGDDRYGQPLWNLLCLGLWAETFQDRSRWQPIH